MPFFPGWLWHLLIGVLLGLMGLTLLVTRPSPTSLAGRNRRFRFAFLAFEENIALFLVVSAISSSHLYPTLQPLLFGLANILGLLFFVTFGWLIYGSLLWRVVPFVLEPFTSWFRDRLKR